MPSQGIMAGGCISKEALEEQRKTQTFIEKNTKDVLQYIKSNRLPKDVTKDSLFDGINHSVPGVRRQIVLDVKTALDTKSKCAPFFAFFTRDTKAVSARVDEFLARCDAQVARKVMGK